MPRIIWRPLPDLPPSQAQDGYVILPSGGVLLSIRPSSKRRLSLTVDGKVLMFRPTMQTCKGGAEELVRTLERECRI